MTDLRKLRDKATEAFAKGKFAKAAEIYGDYCQKDPKDLQARLRMGDAHAKAGNKEHAITAYKAAAEGFARDGFLPRAIAASKLILELDPSHKGVQQTLAELYARKTVPGGADRPMGRSSTMSFKAPSAPPPTPADPPGKRVRPTEIELPPDDEMQMDSGRADAPAGPPPPSPNNRADAIELPPDEPPAPVARTGRAPIELPPDEPPAPVARTGRAPIELPPDEPPAATPPPAAPQPSAARNGPPGLGARKPVEPPPEVELEIEPARVEEIELEVEGTEVPQRVPPAEVKTFDLSDELPPELQLDTSAPAPVAAAPPPPAAAEQSRAGFGPPGLKRRPTETAIPAVQPPRPASRIWMPGQPEGGATATPPPAEPPPYEPPPPSEAPRRYTSDLEAGLAALSRVKEMELEAEQAMGMPPAPAPAPPPQHASADARLPSFTELELEGDSLLHAVEVAAKVGASRRHEAEEAEQDLVEDDRPGDGLPKIPLFSDLPPDAFIELFERCPLIRLGPAEKILAQGTLGDSFYVICSGTVKVFREDNGVRNDIAVLEEGAFFGEMALLSGAPRTASVESASDDTQLLEISAPVLADLSSQYPTVATALKKFCRQRLLSNVMSSSQLFRPFSRDDRKELVRRFRSRDVNRADPIVKEGERSDGMYVVLSGEVEVLKGGRRLATLKEGEVFGEMSLLTKAPATATVAASKRTSLLRLPREDFDQLILSHPQILELVASLTEERRKGELV
jgi:CRP-like cAMP-binding protein